MTGPDAVTRPLLRCHGSKWMLAPWIIEHLPKHLVYVEPFAGGASVLLRKPRSPRGEVYNDLDGEVAALFRVVRDRPRQLARQIAWTPFSREEYMLALQPTVIGDDVELARRFIVRCFMGHGSNANARAVRSGFRANGHRSNTGAASDWASYPPTVHEVARRLRNVVIESRLALSVIEQQDSDGTLFFCDPPYVHSTRKIGAGRGARVGYPHEMTDADHEALAAQLRSVRGMVVLSGYRSALYERLYSDWSSVEKEALADGARPRTEVLWFNAAAWSRLAVSREPLFERVTASPAGRDSESGEVVSPAAAEPHGSQVAAPADQPAGGSGALSSSTEDGITVQHLDRQEVQG